MKKLVIAEKPSVARDLAKVLGKLKKVEDHYENDEYVISSAVGHLVELYMPEDIDKKAYGFWRLGALPIIPEKFKLKPISDKRSKERLDYLKKLIKREDITELYNACDAGREGELIFTYIYEISRTKKPFRRVWMQSMTPASIRKAFDSLRDPEQMSGLKDAARSRSEADWLIGINGTRVITKRMFGRSKGVATVGRVQTPTLSIVLKREMEIRNFNPRPYWKIEGEFSVTEGSYSGFLIKDEGVDKSDQYDKEDRFWKEDVANELLQKIKDSQAAVVSDEKKRTRQSCPKLYDLTSLQREANGRFGFPAAKTLRVAQSLYEKHKVLTYPRTDSRALPEDYVHTVKETLNKVEGELSPFATRALQNNWVKPNKRIFNNAQISDHFAIIPTGELPKSLNTDEAKIFDMVSRRFIGIFFPPAEFDVTTRLSKVEGLSFKTEGKVLAIEGYLEVYGKVQKQSDLPKLVDQDKNPEWLGADNSPELGADDFLAKATSFSMLSEHTKPPARFTEATLLSAMESAGKLVDDEELAEAMKDNGLGTPATRASIIDHLIKEKYIERDARNLVPTVKAENLYEFLCAVNAEQLTQADLTGEWEHKLRLVEENKLSRKDFMKGIIEMTKEVVDRTRDFEEDKAAAPLSSIVSPSDKLPMRELLRSYESQDGEFVVYKTIGNKKLTTEEIQTLVSERVVGPLEGFRSKAGKPFTATLRLDPMNKVSFDFGGDSQDGDDQDGPVDLSKLTAIGVFKESGESVYETSKAFACARNLQNEPGDTFRISKTMLGKELPVEQITNLLDKGKTDLIKGFVSKRTGRPFDAFLILKPKGKIGFEFPPRPAKKKSEKSK